MDVQEQGVRRRIARQETSRKCTSSFHHLLQIQEEDNQINNTVLLPPMSVLRSQRVILIRCRHPRKSVVIEVVYFRISRDSKCRLVANRNIRLKSSPILETYLRQGVLLPTVILVPVHLDTAFRGRCGEHFGPFGRTDHPCLLQIHFYQSMLAPQFSEYQIPIG